MYVSSGTSQA